ncbi:MAG TPA: helical backbone metal receptor [Aquihabitans sp.]|nr:helical backbone metal receptor [Aquihabitans sp.]
MSAGAGGLRVVSLVPSVTESLLSWGVVPVAVTRFCEQPSLLAVGGTKTPDLDAIADLAPDLVVVNDEENRREDADALVARGLEVHVCSPRSVAEVGPAMAALAVAVGIEAAPVDADELAPLGLRAFVPIWRRPWMTLAGDTYGSSLLSSLGVANVFADGDDRYPTVGLADVHERAPDVVLAPSEPYAFKPLHLDALREVAPVVEVDGQDLFWWGVRTPAARRRLHQAIGGAAISPRR